jgi:hypothetical protein
MQMNDSFWIQLLAETIADNEHKQFTWYMMASRIALILSNYGDLGTRFESAIAQAREKYK